MTLTVGLPYPADSNKHAPGPVVADNMPATPLKSTSVNMWLEALAYFDQNRAEDALEVFSQITPTNSKVAYNIASLYSILGNYAEAITFFTRATSFDNYMAISHFQIGVSRFLAGSYAKAADAFNSALKLLRGNSVVNYQQLGLDYKLYSCEIVYNRALAYIYSGALSTGIMDLEFAARERKYIPEHNIIDEALVHFTHMEKVQSKRNVEAFFFGDGASAAGDAGKPLLNLPGALDKKRQRFSVLNPPEKLSFGAAELPELPAEVAPKEMAYSLFSVPQGTLFRLTELKVCSILNDKKLGEMITSGRGHVTFKGANALAKTASSGASSVLERIQSASNRNGAGSRDANKDNKPWAGGLKPELPIVSSKRVAAAKSTPARNNKPQASSGIITPPISPELPLLVVQNGETYTPAVVSAVESATRSSASSSYTAPQGHADFYAQAPGQVASVESLTRLKPQASVQHNEYSELVMPSFNVKLASSPPASSSSSVSSGPESRSAPPPAAVWSSSKTLIHPGASSPLGLYLERSNASAAASESKLSSKSENSLFDDRLSSLMDSDPYDPEYSPDLAGPALGKSAGPRAVAGSQQQRLQTKASSSTNLLKNNNAAATGTPGLKLYSSANVSYTKIPASAYPSSPRVQSSASVKVKIFCGRETRVIKIPQGISFRDFKARIAYKVQSKELEDSPILSSITNNMIIRSKDEDGDLVLLVDQEDLDVAVGEAVGQAPDAPKISIYVKNIFDAEI